MIGVGKYIERANAFIVNAIILKYHTYKVNLEEKIGIMIKW